VANNPNFLITISVEATNVKREIADLRKSINKIGRRSKGLAAVLNKITRKIENLNEFYEGQIPLMLSEAGDTIRSNMLSRYFNTVPANTVKTGDLENAIGGSNFVSMIASSKLKGKSFSIVGIGNIETLDRATTLEKRLKRMARNRGLTSRTQMKRFMSRHWNYPSHLTGRRIAGYWEFQELRPISRHFLIFRRGALHGEDRAIINNLANSIVIRSKNILHKKDLSSQVISGSLI